jgi:hypothetical protein
VRRPGIENNPGASKQSDQCRPDEYLRIPFLDLAGSLEQTSAEEMTELVIAVQ